MFSIFRPKKFVDINLIKTDIHSHLIPGIDDGASGMNESIHLIKGMYNLGYKKLIITPHVRFQIFDNDTSEFDSRLEDVKNVLQQENIPIELEVGCEHTIDEGFKYQFKNGKLKHFGRCKFLLIELPFNSLPINIKEIIFDLQSQDYRLILAHPERYLYLLLQPDMIKYLHDSNILFQLNILSLIGFYGKNVQHFAEKLIKKDYIDLIGSDLHHQQHLDGIKKALSNKTLFNLVESGRLKNSLF